MPSPTVSKQKSPAPRKTQSAPGRMKLYKKVKFNNKAVKTKQLPNRANFSGINAVPAVLYMFSYSTPSRKVINGIKAAGVKKYKNPCPHANKPYIKYNENKMHYKCSSTPDSYTTAAMRVKKMKKNFGEKVNYEIYPGRETMVPYYGNNVNILKKRVLGKRKKPPGQQFLAYFDYFSPAIMNMAKKELKTKPKKVTKMHSEPPLKRTSPRKSPNKTRSI